MSEQGKSTVEMSDGSGCVHSATPHRACGALLSGFLLVILDSWKLLEKQKGAATTTLSSHLGSTLSGTQLQVEIFPLGSDILWGASLRNCLLQTVFHAPKKSSQWRMLHRELAVRPLTQQGHSRPTYSASVISLQCSYNFQQELQDLLYLQRHHRLAEKDFERAKSGYFSAFINGNIACQLAIIQAKARMVGNHKCFMEVLTGSSIPEWAVRRMVSRKSFLT